MASNKLHVDVWDGESLLLLGSLSIPLWRLMRQGNPVTKIAHEVMGKGQGRFLLSA